MVVLLAGLLSMCMGAVFLYGCFVRVDSQPFLERARGDEAKIANLRSLQAAWDKLGRMKQFRCSVLGYLIFGCGLLLVAYDPSWSRYWWAVPASYAVNFVSLIDLNGYAKTALNSGSHGDSRVLRVIKQNMRMCAVFSVIYVSLVVRGG